MLFSVRCLNVRILAVGAFIVTQGIQLRNARPFFATLANLISSNHWTVTLDPVLCRTFPARKQAFFRGSITKVTLLSDKEPIPRKHPKKRYVAILERLKVKELEKQSETVPWVDDQETLKLRTYCDNIILWYSLAPIAFAFELSLRSIMKVALVQNPLMVDNHRPFPKKIVAKRLVDDFRISIDRAALIIINWD